jgi:PAS domain-containing protein
MHFVGIRKNGHNGANGANDTEVIIHDSTQLEIKTLHVIPEGIPLGKDITYIQDIYFFLPKSFGLHSEAYSKELFYRSLTNYIRVKTPQVIDGHEIENCRLDRILPKVTTATAQGGAAIEDIYILVDEVRLFGAFMNDQLKIIRSMDRHEPRQKRLIFLRDLLDSYRRIMDALEPLIDEPDWLPLGNALRYVDEYVSNQFEEAVLAIGESGVDLKRLMEPEFNRRTQKDYLQIIKSDMTMVDEESRERFVFRMGRFKKYVSEILYLELKRSKHDSVFTNIAAAIGAAIAAFIHALADPNAQTSMSGHFFQSLRGSLPLMIGVVAAVYVFKDRVKETLRVTLLYWFKPLLPDYSFKITSRMGQEIAQCKEDVRFINTIKAPNDVITARRDNSEIILPSDSFEDVIQYNRSLIMHRKKLEDLFPNTNTLKDIIRFDFNPFLARLSNPRHKDRFISWDGRVVETELPKVYHVNIVVRHRTLSKSIGELACAYTRVRVILDKNGIKRIDNVAIDLNKVQAARIELVA